VKAEEVWGDNLGPEELSLAQDKIPNNLILSYLVSSDEFVTIVLKRRLLASL
jgi:hypothetical protein